MSQNAAYKRWKQHIELMAPLAGVARLPDDQALLPLFSAHQAPVDVIDQIKRGAV